MELTFDCAINLLKNRPNCKSVSGMFVAFSNQLESAVGAPDDCDSFAFAKSVACAVESRLRDDAPLANIITLLETIAKKPATVRAELAASFAGYLAEFDQYNLSHRAWSVLFQESDLDSVQMAQGKRPYQMHSPQGIALAHMLMANAQKKKFTVPDWWMNVPA